MYVVVSYVGLWAWIQFFLCSLSDEAGSLRAGLVFWQELLVLALSGIEDFEVTIIVHQH